MFWGDWDSPGKKLHVHKAELDDYLSKKSEGRRKTQEPIPGFWNVQQTGWQSQLLRKNIKRKRMSGGQVLSHSNNGFHPCNFSVARSTATTTVPRQRGERCKGPEGAGRSECPKAPQRKIGPFEFFRNFGMLTITEASNFVAFYFQPPLSIHPDSR